MSPITSALQKLRSDTVYLGDPDAHARLEWIRSGNDNIAVKKGDDVNDQISSKHLSNHQQPGSPTLSAIVLLTEEDFWLSSDGYWEDPTPSSPSFADVTISCTGAAPPPKDILADFGNVVENINVLVGRMRTRERNMKHVRVLSAITLSPKVKFQHNLFKKRHLPSPETVGENEVQNVYAEADDQALDISTAHWPTNSRASAAALYDIRGTHRIRPLPAFDINGQVVQPGNYRQLLAGAVVQIKFTLMHRAISSSPETPGFDKFRASIIGINVLQSPTVSAARAYKHFNMHPRLTDNTDDGEASKVNIGRKRKNRE